MKVLPYFLAIFLFAFLSVWSYTPMFQQHKYSKIVFVTTQSGLGLSIALYFIFILREKRKRGQN